jgi:hypothetical protein
VSSCNDKLYDMRSEGIVMTMRLVETCLRASPNIATELVKPMLPRIFEYVFTSVIYSSVLFTSVIIYSNTANLTLLLTGQTL